MNLNTIFLIVIVSFITIHLHAQQTASSRAVVGITQFSSGELNGLEKNVDGIRSLVDDEPAQFVRQNIEVPLKGENSFLAFAVVWEAKNWEPSKNKLWVKFKGENSEPVWKELIIDPHADKDGRRHVSELTFVENNVEKLDVKIVFEKGSEALVQNLKLHFYDPGTMEKKSGTPNSGAIQRSSCTCPEPDYEDRADWCPAGDCPEITSPTITDVTHLIVHHSAGVNSSSDWAAVVRSIWDFHVNVNGWDDVGYNYLVDPNGVLYEGRGNNVQGAHFCGANGGTMGVCMMGDFTNISPTTAAKETLKDLLAWKVCDIDADPEGSEFHTGTNAIIPRISGHQDGCATECPGATFYPELSTIRTEVDAQINDECEVEDLAAPTNLTAEALSTTSVKLDWEDNSNNELTFVIERSELNNSNYEIVGNTNSNVNTFTDQNLQPNTAYFYQVKATSNQIESDYSNQVGVATVLTNTKNVGKLPVVIYPNPVNDLLSISLPNSDGQTFEGKIIELGSSKLVRQFSIESASKRVEYDVADLPAGIYLLQINNGKENGFAKFVKQ